MIYKEILPPELLASFVRHFWSIDHSSSHDLQTTFRLMADGFPSLIFQHKTRFPVGNLGSSDFPPTILLGHSYNYRDLIIKGDFSLFGVSFYPYALELLFKIPAKESTNLIIDAEALFTGDWRLLREQIFLAKDHYERAGILAAFLLKKLKYRLQGDLLIQNMVQSIVRADGISSVRDMVKRINISRRQFERRFFNNIGFSPKLFSRIIRFQHTLRYPNNHRLESLTHLAFIRGYADQSHFIREFQAFSGINPGYYFKNHHEAAENLIPLD